MGRQIPNSVIGATASVIGQHYYSHSKLDTLFMESGAPGEPPVGNCESKCALWLRRCNEDDSVDALDILGEVIQDFMELEPYNGEVEKGQQRIRDALAKNSLSYHTNGRITHAGSAPVAIGLSHLLKRGDFVSVEREFERAYQQLVGDPYAAITAACAIIEALCKTYIETFALELPSKITVVPLWRTVQGHLGLNPDATLAEDQRKMLQGLASVVDGVGAYRTHIGSAHGRGIAPPKISVSEARLAVNAAHTLVTFIMEIWHDPNR